MNCRSLPLVLLSILALATTFAAGLVAQRMLLPEARADSVVAISTIYVPPGGLLFQSRDGKPIARLSRDEAGGVFELYDNRQQVAKRVHSMPPASANAYVIDDVDRGIVALDPGF